MFDSIIVSIIATTLYNHSNCFICNKHERPIWLRRSLWFSKILLQITSHAWVALGSHVGELFRSHTSTLGLSCSRRWCRRWSWATFSCIPNSRLKSVSILEISCRFVNIVDDVKEQLAKYYCKAISLWNEMYITLRCQIYLRSIL